MLYNWVAKDLCCCCSCDCCFPDLIVSRIDGCYILSSLLLIDDDGERNLHQPFFAAPWRNDWEPESSSLSSLSLLQVAERGFSLLCETPYQADTSGQRIGTTLHAFFSSAQKTSRVEKRGQEERIVVAFGSEVSTLLAAPVDFHNNMKVKEEVSLGSFHFSHTKRTDTAVSIL